MTVYQPRNSPYFHYDFVWKGRRFHGSTGLANRRQAEAFEARVRSDAILGTRARPPITVDEAAGLYAERVESLPSWPTTRYILRDLVAGLGANRLLPEITQRDLQMLVARRRDGRSNATVNRELEVWRAMWRHAERSKYEVGDMPDWRSLRLKVAEQDPRELTIVEEPRLFEHLRADLVDVCDFALKSGWRRAEVFGLRWADVDLSAMQARTRIKGGKIVKRPLTPTLVAIIANQPKVGPFVFTYVAQRTKPAFTDKKGRKHPARQKGHRYPITATALRRPWADAKDDAKIPDFRFHDLRHTRGTRIVRATGNLAAAKKALQHSSIKTTLRYAHVMDDDVRDALEVSESRTIPETATSSRIKKR